MLVSSKSEKNAKFKTICIPLWPCWCQSYSNSDHKKGVEGQRFGWTVKSTGCSFNKPRFISQFPYDVLQPCVPPVLGNTVLTYDLHGYQAGTECMFIHAGKTPPYIKCTRKYSCGMHVKEYTFVQF